MVMPKHVPDRHESRKKTRMDLGDLEREHLRGMRAITIDAGGEEIFVGLTAEESLEYLALSRRNENGEAMSRDERFVDLQLKHEEARQHIMKGDASLDGTHLR
jgi:hypothetical protein